MGVTDGVDEKQLLTLAWGVNVKVGSFESIGRIIVSLQGALVCCCEWLPHYFIKRAFSSVHTIPHLQPHLHKT